MAIRQLPDPALLRKIISYDPLSGELTWLPRTPDLFRNTGKRNSPELMCRIWNTKNAGKPAFNHAHGSNHLSGGLFGQLVLAHRVAWAIHFGASEFGLIDHINGNGRDNRIANLRLSNRAQNSQNARKRKDCTSGVTGVNWHDKVRWGRAYWVARIQCGNKRIFLGSFEHLEDAIAARRDAEARYGFGPAHGKAKP